MARHLNSRQARGVGLVLFASLLSIGAGGLGASGVSADDLTLLFHVDGSPAACVAAYVGQGIPLGQAADLCEVSIGMIPGGGDLGGGIEGMFGSFPGFSNSGSGPISVSCAAPGAGADPKLALTPEEEALIDFDRANGTPPTDGAAAAKYAAERAALAAAATASRLAKEEQRTDLDRRKTEAVLTSQMLRDLGGKTSTAHDIVVKNNGGGTDGGTKQTVDLGTTACQGFAAFVGECNLAGWATSPCQMLRNQMSGCADQTIALTTGDPVDGCSNEVDGETVGALVHLRCSLRGKVAPGYDPCGPPETGGGLGIYRLPNGDTCEPTPWSSTTGGEALTTGEGCERKFEATMPDVLQRAPSLGTLVVVFGGPGGPTTTDGGGQIAPPPGCKTCGF